jgi:hypothetical protein
MLPNPHASQKAQAKNGRVIYYRYSPVKVLEVNA